jgi:ABC-type nitrate/sulfonate/bicarbonate transport system substrate-binding protein
MQRVVLGAVVGLVSCFVVACGGGNESGGSTSHSGSTSAAPAATETTARADLQPLKIAFPASVTSTMPTYVAAAQGLFEREGLEVEITDGLGANVANVVVSGQYDIGMIGLATPITVAEQGKPTSVTYGLGGGGSGGMLLGGPRIRTLEELQSKDGCRVATFPPGAASNGNAQQYRQSFLRNCDIVPLTDLPTLIAAVSAGRADAMVGNFNTAVAQAVDQGKLHILVDTRDAAQRERALGADRIVSEFGEWGIKDNLEAKRASVVAYYRAVDAARAFIATASDEEVAELLKTQRTFADRSLEELTSEVRSNRAYLTVGSDDGYITEEQWNATVEAYAAWGIQGVEPGSEVSSYAERVDMSYLAEATGRE